jgi:hypothetical protein
MLFSSELRVASNSLSEMPLTFPEINSFARRSKVASVTGSRKGTMVASSNSSARRTRCDFGRLKAILRIAVKVMVWNFTLSVGMVKEEGILSASKNF